MLVFCLFGQHKIDERQQVVFVGKWDKLSILFIGNKWRETNCSMNLARHSDLVPQSPAFSVYLCCFARFFTTKGNHPGKSLEIWILKDSKYGKCLIHNAVKYHFWSGSATVQICFYFLCIFASLHVLHWYSRNVDP